MLGKHTCVMVLLFLSFASQGFLWALPAGVLPYADFHGKTVILLGMDCHRRGFWIDFGGESNGQETRIETAAREFSEETMFCLFRTVPEVENILKESVPIVSNGYYMYPLHVPFIYDLNKVHRALRAKHHIRGVPASGARWAIRHHIEKIDYVWVLADALKEAIISARGNYKKVVLNSIDGRTIKLHKLLACTLSCEAGQLFLTGL